MLLASLQFQTRRDKRAEFVHTAENVVAALRRSHGCLECRLMADCEVRGSYTLVSRWVGHGPLRRFLESDDFHALLGTRILLRDPPGVFIDEVLHRTLLPGAAETGSLRRDQR